MALREKEAEYTRVLRWLILRKISARVGGAFNEVYRRVDVEGKVLVGDIAVIIKIWGKVSELGMMPWVQKYVHNPM